MQFVSLKELLFHQVFIISHRLMREEKKDFSDTLRLSVKTPNFLEYIPYFVAFDQLYV